MNARLQLPVGEIWYLLRFFHEDANYGVKEKDNHVQWRISQLVVRCLDIKDKCSWIQTGVL